MLFQTTTPPTRPFDPVQIAREALSPHERYCDGYGNPGASGKGYVLGCVLSTGLTPSRLAHAGSTGLDEIVAYDTAEVADAYIGQISMSSVSSFCGPWGVIWGYDLAHAPNLTTPHPLFADAAFPLPVYALDALTSATTALFGRVEAQHFPFLPGSQVPCAGRTRSVVGEGIVYAAMAIAIPRDRSRHAALLMEDAGEIHATSVDAVLHVKQTIVHQLAESILAVGHNQHVEYERIFLDVREVRSQPGMTACALVACPYLTLARQAVPDRRVERLIDSSLAEWEDRCSPYFVSA